LWHICRVKLLAAQLLVFLIMTALPLPSSGSTFLESFRDSTRVLPNREIRAAWVVRHALASRDEIDRAVDYAIRARFQLLFVQVRGRGDAYYRSSFEPAATELKAPIEQFDPLAYFIERAHTAGIAVHAWVNVFYVWSDFEERPPAGHIVLENPEWLMGDDTGTRMDERPVKAWQARGLEGYYVSPGDLDARLHTTRVIAQIASDYDVDGIHLDYVRYPGRAFDFSPRERTRFALRFGVDPLELRADPDAMAALLGDPGVTSADSLWNEWRVAQVDSLVHRVRGAIGKVPLSAAVVPDLPTARADKGQDWLGWVRRGDVDFVVPMAYAYEPAELVARVELIKRTIGTSRFLVGLPVYDGRDRYLGYSVSLLRQEGVIGYSLFSYNVLAEQSFSLEFLQRVFFGDVDDDSDAGVNGAPIEDGESQ